MKKREKNQPTANNSVATTYTCAALCVRVCVCLCFCFFLLLPNVPCESSTGRLSPTAEAKSQGRNGKTEKKHQHTLRTRYVYDMRGGKKHMLLWMDQKRVCVVLPALLACLLQTTFDSTNKK